MTQPESIEDDWALLLAIEASLAQLEKSLPLGCRLTLELPRDNELPLVLEYSREACRLITHE